jgi:hypothetical protein
MATVMSRDPFIHHSSAVRTVGVVLLAMALAFITGRATASRGAALPGDPARPVALPAQAPPAPPTAQRFREDETTDDICTAPNCSG